MAQLDDKRPRSLGVPRMPTPSPMEPRDPRDQEEPKPPGVHEMEHEAEAEEMDWHRWSVIGACTVAGLVLVGVVLYFLLG